MAAEAQFQAPASGDHASGEVDHLLDNRLNPSSLRLMADDALAADQGCLSHEAQDVVHQGTAGHDQLVRRNLGGQV